MTTIEELSAQITELTAEKGKKKALIALEPRLEALESEVDMLRATVEDLQNPIPEPEPEPEPEPDPTLVTVLQGDFHPKWYEDPQWAWVYGSTGTKGDIRVKDRPNFNGHNGIEVTFPKGKPGIESDVNRFGGDIKLDKEYDEIIFTFDFMLNDDWVPGQTGGTGKFPRVQPYEQLFGANSIPACDEGFAFRLVWRGRLDEEGIKMKQHNFHPDKPSTESDGPFLSKRVPKGRLNTFKYHIKLNSKADIRDGFFKTYLNDELVASSDLRMYCGNENNKMGIGEIRWNVFHGGSDPRYAPSQDSTITWGGYKIQIPVA